MPRPALRVGLTGRMTSGKTTLARALADRWGYEVRSIKAPLVGFVRDINPGWDAAVRDLGYDEAKATVPFIRQELLDVGQAARRHFGEDVLLRRVVANLPSGVVIDDVRYPDESRFLLSYGFHIVCVCRPGVTDRSEETVSADYTLVNDGTVDDLVEGFLQWTQYVSPYR